MEHEINKSRASYRSQGDDFVSRALAERADAASDARVFRVTLVAIGLLALATLLTQFV